MRLVPNLAAVPAPLWTALLGMALLAAFSPLVEAQQIRFTDVSSAAGVNGDNYLSVSNHSLGANWIDFNLDGWPDLFAVGGGPNRVPHLFENQGDGTFLRVDNLLPSLPNVEMSGSRFADYDRDGDPDLFIYTDNKDWCLFCLDTPEDGPPNLLLKNLWIENGGAVVPGSPLFQEAAAAAGLDDLASPSLGLLDGHRTKTAAWLDYDRDGCIDLFVGHLAMNHFGEPSNRDRLYRNQCDGTFEEVTAAAGMDPGAERYRPTLACGGFHLNDDLWPDLYAASIASREDLPDHEDLVFLNQGPGQDGVVTFSESTASWPGVGDDTQAAMGLDVADIDLDGDWDVYISDVIDSYLDAEPLGNALYLNNGSGFDDNSAPAAGLTGLSSWGVNFFDMDHDGWEDLYVASLFVDDPVLLYHHQGLDMGGNATFTNVGATAGFITYGVRGSAVADYDRDGDLDIAVVNQNGPLQLLRNDTVSSGHWLMIELEATLSNLDAIGTIVEITTGSTVRRRQVKGGSSAHSQDGMAVHFGLGSATAVDLIRVRWPSGLETELTNPAVDRYITVREPWVFGDGFETGDLSAWSNAAP